MVKWGWQINIVNLEDGSEFNIGSLLFRHNPKLEMYITERLQATVFADKDWLKKVKKE